MGVYVDQYKNYNRRNYEKDILLTAVIYIAIIAAVGFCFNKL